MQNQGERERRRNKAFPLIHHDVSFPLFNRNTDVSQISIFFSNFHTFIHAGLSALRLLTLSPKFEAEIQPWSLSDQFNTSFSMKTSPSTGTYLLSCKSTLLLTFHHTCFQFFLMTLITFCLGMGYLCPCLHPHTGLWLLQGSHALLCMSLGTMHRIWHCLLIKSTNARRNRWKEGTMV